MSEHFINVDEARRTCVEALGNAGVPLEHARVQVDLLMEAQLRGRASHGLLRLPRIVERVRRGIADPITRGELCWRGNSLLHVNGRQGLGPVIAFHALEQITLRAKETGVAVASIEQCNHLGMIALYAERVAAQGQILIAMTTSEALVHPWGGRTAMIGTNPVAIGVPAAPHPFVLDMATSLISMGQVHDYAHRGTPLETGWALDANGDPTLDATAAKQGSIAPFGGAKGYALGLAFEVLVASLTASAMGVEVKGTLDAEHPCNKGDVFIVIEPAAGGAATQVGAYLDAIRRSPPQRADRPVLVPGDRAHRQRARSLEDGISIAPDVWRSIRELAIS
ncbi:Ldh family oxidoreductase [Paraburkholderia sp. Cy-641]|uniref:Ldh family oxidoreductase n=1 Tax=Paraburkholderia sp. Cy-641 TaxID=2608337 RepID=UPI0014212655|nr:Ldh family oxidoreductase [Paraburkholderia sp. Cy-641]NIF80464.1 Ldh family oxidoreductase [Paraburkholderia sp. Cy-641]